MTHILLFDTNPIDCRVTRQILADGSHQSVIHATTHPRELLVQLARESIDLLIIDIPTFDLYHTHLIREIRNIGGTTPILITTVAQYDEISSEAWRQDVQALLFKPYRRERLLSTVTKLVAEKNSEPRQPTSFASQYFPMLEHHMAQFDYQSMRIILCNYLDALWDSDADATLRLQDAQTLAQKLSQIYSPLNQKGLTQVAQALSHLSQPKTSMQKYDLFVVYEEILGGIFQSVESNPPSELSDGQKIRNFIDRRVRQGVTLSQVAQYSNMSVSYFSKVFQKLTGMKFIDYVTVRKMDFARQLLRDTKLSIQAIALELSFGETNYFSKAFRKHTGVPPSVYRGNPAPYMKNV